MTEHPTGAGKTVQGGGETAGTDILDKAQEAASTLRVVILTASDIVDAAYGTAACSLVELMPELTAEVRSLRARVDGWRHARGRDARKMELLQGDLDRQRAEVERLRGALKEVVGELSAVDQYCTDTGQQAYYWAAEKIEAVLRGDQ